MQLVIEAGDTVKLRSGGEVMTVEAVDEDRIVCVWHDKMSRLQRATFLRGLLKQSRAFDLDAAGRAYHADRTDIEAYRRSLGFNDA